MEVDTAFRLDSMVPIYVSIIDPWRRSCVFLCSPLLRGHLTINRIRVLGLSYSPLLDSFDKG